MNEQQENFFKETKELVVSYFKNRLLLFKLQSSQKLAKLAGIMFTALILSVIGFFIVLFISIMAGYLFASWLHSTFAGFGVVAAVYVLLFIILYQKRKTLLQRFIINTVINVLFDEDEKKDKDFYAG